MEMQPIPWCDQCLGLHPDELPTKEDFVLRKENPNAHIVRTVKNRIEKIDQYKNSVCCMCGRSCNAAGLFDPNWTLTKRMVYLELQEAGIGGLQDMQIQILVGKLHGMFLFKLKKGLLKNGIAEFAHCLEVWIHHNQGKSINLSDARGPGGVPTF